MSALPPHSHHCPTWAPGVEEQVDVGLRIAPATHCLPIGVDHHIAAVLPHDGPRVGTHHQLQRGAILLHRLPLPAALVVGVPAKRHNHPGLVQLVGVGA